MITIFISHDSLIITIKSGKIVRLDVIARIFQILPKGGIKNEIKIQLKQQKKLPLLAEI